MTALIQTIIQVKKFAISYSYDLLVLLGLSFFSKFWYALTNEFSVVLVAHIFVLCVVAIFVRLVGRWIGEEIDSFSDVEFMARFECDREVFERLKDPNTHGKMYRQNYDYFIFDQTKLKVFSKFMGIKTVETFQVIDKGDTVVLKNISGKYESYVTYEYDGSGIVGHWVAKPKGIRRAMALLLYRVAKRSVIEDFTKFVNK